MTNTETIIADVLNRYVLRYPREPGNKDYPVPLDVLHRISELRKQYPLTNTAQAAMREPYKIPRLTQPSSRFRYSRCLSALLSAGRVTPQLFHVRSGRLRTIPRTVLARVLRLHKRMGYAPEDVMCMAVEPKKGKPLWRNTKVTAKEIRTVFQWEPCLICVLAKRRKEGTMKWKTLKKNKRRKLRLSEEDEKKLIQQEIRSEWENLEAIRSEWENLRKKTLVPVSKQELEQYVSNGGDYEKIGLTMKTKMKLKPDGTLDKFKGRGAGRGDQWVRQRIKKGKPLPKTFSPTVKPLTFAWIQQLAIVKKLYRSTSDVKLAYLNCIYPDDIDWIVVYLEPWIADALGIERDQLFRVRRYIYGLPEAGRAFYELFKSKLEEEGYTMSAMDPCLFYRIQGDEETYIVIFVDDSFVYSNRKEYIREYEHRMRTHFEITTDPEAESFLGVTFTYDEEGNCKLGQKKLLTKLFNENPPLNTGKRRRPLTHPYGPAPTHGEEPTEEDKQAVDITLYLRLLGLLMYLTKSRPEISTAVSFGATNSHNPLQCHYKELLHVVEFLRATPDDGLIIRVSQDSRIQFYCQVDASYLLHKDSKGHTGYAIGLTGGGYFYIRSSKQALVSTSSTHAEMRAIYTLVKDLLFIIYICHELRVELQLPALIFEDNSAVVTVTTEENAYAKKCKHFLMVINYVREQINLGLIKIDKIAGTKNNADLLTKKLRDGTFLPKRNALLGLPAQSKMDQP